MESKMKKSLKKKITNSKKMDGEIDPRFVETMKNPIFRRVPKKEKKIDIDKRFQSMFHDKKFKLKSSVDKRGRPIDFSTDEDLKKYYHLVDSEEDENPGDNADTDVGDSKLEEQEGESSSGSEADQEIDDIEGNVKESEIRSVDSKLKLSKTIKKKIRDVNVDYARGEGNLIAEESSDDSSSTDDDDEEETTHAWGELDRDAARTEEATTRLALCNMDWDRIKAVDLMVLFHSFLPPGGVLKTIKIYTSEYGKQRLADEEVNGPLELRQGNGSVENPSGDESDADKESIGGDDEEGSHFQMEKLRQYQLNRLKYYYAVLEFDSVESAEKLYTECDGQEYESSSTRIDLRYIPEDMTFDDEPKDSCDRIPQADKYRPQFFTTTALQQAKVDLTWDETDPRRKELTNRVFDPKEKVDDEDIRAYLASSSEDEDAVLDDQEDSDGDGSSSVDPMAKYRALLESIEDSQNKKKDKDVEMEITWGVGLKKKTEGLVKKKLEESQSKNLTPWEEILEKKREKKKQRRKEKKQNAGATDDKSSGDSSNDEDEAQLFSDDDVDVDMNDPFFKEEMSTNKVFDGSKKKKKNKVVVEKPDAKKDADNATLELLLMDDHDDDNKHHFSLKKILKNESTSKSKKKWKNKRSSEVSDKKAEFQDNFEVDVKDERFGALFSSHLYNMDPSDPNFKKTKGMESIITEKQKRRLVNPTDDKTRDLTEEASAPKVSKKSELSYLVKSIKRNAQHMKKLQNKK